MDKATSHGTFRLITPEEEKARSLRIPFKSVNQAKRIPMIFVGSKNSKPKPDEVETRFKSTLERKFSGQPNVYGVFSRPEICSTKDDRWNVHVTLYLVAKPTSTNGC
jgi:hypothetical protein